MSVRNKHGDHGFNYDVSEKKREEIREKYSHFDAMGNDRRKLAKYKEDWGTK